jgi:gamma-butyrobetaine dioxygenase|tara:strand:- start:178 stop:1323 length:1146 start_codon:yes stop_codon:yes gene_type:complete
MYSFKSVRIIDKGKSIILQRTDGSTLRYHSTWLRDNALDPKTRDPKNRQRLIVLSDIPIDTSIKSVNLDTKGENVSLTFFPESKKVSFSSSWLETHAYDVEKKLFKGWVSSNLKVWKSNMSKNIPIIDYKTAKSNNILLLKWMRSLYEYGFAKITGVDKVSGAIIQIANLIGYIRETNYGKFFDVKSEINAVNLAYTNLGLQAHTDNPYRDPVPTMQILYCIKNSTSGGDSKVVDGFKAAILLKEKNQKYFNLLSKYCARFEYDGDEKTHLESRRPMIELSPDGEIIAIRFNNRSTAPITDVPYSDMENYYSAYRKFSEIINNHSMAVNFKLKPGEGFIVDNTRVLHSRTAYSGSGNRWLQGCYVDKDGLLSKISTLSKKV